MKKTELLKLKRTDKILPQTENQSELQRRKKSLSKLRILCIDDSLTLQSLVKESLSLAGYEVIGNVNPLKSLMFLLETRNPDLIITDIEMPDVEGHKLLELIKRSTKLKNIPVIVLSSRNTESDRFLAHSLGAIDYITKPFSCDHLVTVVEQVISNRSKL